MLLRPLGPRAAAAAILALLLVAGLWPYREILGWLPWGADALKWVARGASDEPGWARWVFATKHFVGYRPITALSFTLNHALTGWSALGYRATDLALHLLGGALVFAVYRRLTGDRSVFSLVPVLLLLGHPATEEVVPYVARRSYLLATVFGLSSLLLAVEAASRATRRWAWGVGCAVAVGLAVLSNEVAYVFVPLLPLVAHHFGGRERRAYAALLPTALVVIGAVAARWAVLGTLGGYHKRYFAFVHRGLPVWQELRTWQPTRIALACWEHAVDPVSVTGSAPLFHGPAQEVAAAVFLCWLLWVGLLRPASRWRTCPEERVLVGLVAWAAGAVGIVVLSQTWFWRQAHGVVLPLGMIAAYGLKTAVAGLLQNQLRELPGLVAGLGLGAAMTLNGPLVGGLDRAAHQNVIDGTPLARRIERLVPQIDGPGTVYLVAPLRATGAHILRLWGDRYGADRGLEFRLLGHLTVNGVPGRATLDLTRDPAPTLGFERAMTLAKAPGLDPERDNGGFLVSRLWRGERRRAWLMALDADDAWVLAVPAPPAGVKVVPDVRVPEPEEDP